MPLAKANNNQPTLQSMFSSQKVFGGKRKSTESEQSEHAADSNGEISTSKRTNGTPESEREGFQKQVV